MRTKKHNAYIKGFLVIILFSFLFSNGNYGMFAPGAIAWASELKVESALDQSPTALKVLNERAQGLEKRFNELEERLAIEQMKIVGHSESGLVELSMSLAPRFDGESFTNPQGLLVSHMRMSLNGRPHIYNQDPLLVSESFPVPLYLGLIKSGKHLVRLQFQASHYSGVDEPVTKRSWVKVDETFTIDLESAESGKVERNVLVFPAKGRITVGLQSATK